MLDRIDNEFSFVRDALQLRAKRQEVLASNIANADTPHYKARDFDFKTALAHAMGGKSGDLALTRTSPAHLPGDKAAGSVGGVPLLYRSVVQPSIDGNTVDMDLERGAFAENAIHYQFLIDRASATARTYLSAIQPEGR
jgi:flagellar basal-body rod protein FlgB